MLVKFLSRHRWLLAVIGTLTILVLLATTQNAKTAEPHLASPLALLRATETPQQVPDLLVRDADGTKIALESYRGKTLLINIWATWCGPCRFEMPSLARLQAELGGPRFAVLPLSVDRQGAKVVEKFYADKSIQNLPVLIANGLDIVANLKERALPFSLIVDAEGREVARIVGPAQWDDAEFIAYLKTLMGPASDE